MKVSLGVSAPRWATRLSPHQVQRKARGSHRNHVQTMRTFRRLQLRTAAYALGLSFALFIGCGGLGAGMRVSVLGESPAWGESISGSRGRTRSMQQPNSQPEFAVPIWNTVDVSAEGFLKH